MFCVQKDGRTVALLESRTDAQSFNGETKQSSVQEPDVDTHVPLNLSTLNPLVST